MDQQKIFISKIKASTGQVYDAIDGKMNTRWASKMSDPQWIWIDLGRPTEFSEFVIHWEVAYGKVYDILVSNDNNKIFSEENSDGKIDDIKLAEQIARFIKIDFKKRGTEWGYSIWEMEIK